MAPSGISLSNPACACTFRDRRKRGEVEAGTHQLSTCGMVIRGQGHGISIKIQLPSTSTVHCTTSVTAMHTSLSLLHWASTSPAVPWMTLHVTVLPCTACTTTGDICVPKVMLRCALGHGRYFHGTWWPYGMSLSKPVCVHIQRQEEQKGGRRRNPLVIHTGSPLRSSHWNVWCDIINWTHFKNKSPWTCADWDSVPPANLLTIVQHSLMLHVQYSICSCQYMILTLRSAHKCRQFACMLVHHAELVLLVVPCTQCKATLFTFLKPLWGFRRDPVGRVPNKSVMRV